MATMGSLPVATTFSTWAENIEVFSVDDDTLYDFTGVTEIIVKLRDPSTKFDELSLTMTGGAVTLPAPGIIQWRAEASQMGTLDPKTYEGIILLKDDTDTVTLMFGPVSVIG